MDPLERANELALRQQERELEQQARAKRSYDVTHKGYDQLTAADKRFAFDEGLPVDERLGGPGAFEFNEADRAGREEFGGIHIDLFDVENSRRLAAQGRWARCLDRRRPCP
jgi:hypothetical protein